MESVDKPIVGKDAGSRLIALSIGLAAALYVLVQVFSMLAPILLSFVLIVLLTLALNPIISSMRSWTGGRRRSAAVALCAFVIFGGLAVWGSIAPLKKAAITLSESLPEYWERLQKPLIKMEQQAVITEKKLQEEVSAEINTEIEDNEEPIPGLQPLEPLWSTSNSDNDASPQSKEGEGGLRSNLIGAIQGVFGEARGVVNSTTEIFVICVTVFFGVIFSLMNPRPIFAAMFSMVPQRHHSQFQKIMVQIAEFVPRWAGSVLISMLFIGILFFVLMWPIFGIADALMLGLIAGILSVIPLLGPLLTLIPALILAMGIGGMAPLWVLAAYMVVQGLESYVIIPLIMSGVMKVHPLALIFSVILSIAIFGILGVLIAVPLAIIVGIVHREVYRSHFMPLIEDGDLDRLAGTALLEKLSIES